MRWAWIAIFCATGFAQQWEIGASVGYGVYRNASVEAPAGKVTAGFGNRFATGAVIGEDLYEHIAGEFRYLYQDGDPFVSAGGKQANIQGQSHAFHYDLLFHLRPREARLRPFAAVGGGVKWYTTTGPEPQVQPFPGIVTLTASDHVRPLVTVGGGVKYRVAKHVLLRADFRDYITPFPKKLFVPAEGGTDRGIFHQFTPLFGVSYWF
jgi:hypothetical protein